MKKLIAVTALLLSVALPVKAQTIGNVTNLDRISIAERMCYELTDYVNRLDETTLSEFQKEELFKQHLKDLFLVFIRELVKKGYSEQEIDKILLDILEKLSRAKGNCSAIY